MKNNLKIKIVTLFITILFLLLPISVLAVGIDDESICKNCSSDSYYTNKYKTNGSYRARDLRNIKGFTTGNQRLFCVEPTKLHANSGYTRTSSFNEAYSKVDSIWKDGFNDLDDLKKVLSCWSNNDDSIAATQLILWELISEERSKIDENTILKRGDYAPYMSDGKTFKSKTGKNQSYDVINGNLYEEYKSTLRCAARFNINPSFAYSAQSRAVSNPYVLTNYDDTTQTFSRTFSHTGIDGELLKYYNVSNSSGLTIEKTNYGIKISTKKEILKASDAALVTLKYVKKDNGSYNLNDDPTYFYYKSSRQLLMQGSTTNQSYISVYTGARPTYKLRVRKINEDNEPVSNVKFNVFSDAELKTKIGITTASDKDGWSYLEGINKIGKYYVQEAETPDSYQTNKEVLTIDVTSANRQNGKYAESTSSFVNKYMHLKLSKRTIDENGNQIDIGDYTGNNCTGTYKGPIFMLKKDGKNIYFKELSSGNYKVSSDKDENASVEIKTCNGKFDIKAIESGCYDVTEIKAPDGYTLPSNPIQKVCVVKGKESTITVMYNGVTGIIFNKVSEDGNLIDGGKFSLQQKSNGIYKDILLKHESGAVYSYVENLSEEIENSTYVLETKDGVINVKNLPPGEYRFVEKQAPEGYDIIKDKDSSAVFTISDKGIFGKDGKPVTDYYQVKLVNQKTKVEGSYDSAELIVTIITGRKVANYTLIIAGLAVLLTVLIIIRKKSKK